MSDSKRLDGWVRELVLLPLGLGETAIFIND